MALPLPSVVSDVGPGGPLVTSMRGINALTDSNLGNVIKGVQAKYAPITVPAEAASKLAYANLMGPQFLAKLMGNQDILGNLSGDQFQNMMRLVYGAGTGQTTGNALVNNPGLLAAIQNQISPQNNSLLGNIVRNVKNAFGLGDSQNASPTNALLTNPNLSQQDRANITNMQPGQSYTIQGTGAGMNNNPNSGYSYDQNGNNVRATPEQIDQIANAGSATLPNTPAENAGEYAKTKALRAEQGKIIANDINELDKQYEGALKLDIPLNSMEKIITDPVFQNMRKFPFFQGLQLNAKAKVGTPEEQKIIGKFITESKRLQADTVNSFAGRALVKEFDIANQMKIDDKDSFGVILGKYPAIREYNEFTKQRSRIASQLMNQKKMTRGDALEQADKMVNGAAIRSEIEKSLDYPIQVKNIKTGQSMTMPASQARKLGVPNV